MIDLEELRHALSEMTERTQLYSIVKAEMEKRGRWKVKERGEGFHKGFDRRRKGLK